VNWAWSPLNVRWKWLVLPAADLDLIIVATSTPDYIFPSTACLIQGKLGNKRAAAFDVQAVCAGFTYALGIAEKFIRSGSHKKRWSSARKFFRVFSTGVIVAPACCLAMAPAQSFSKRQTSQGILALQCMPMVARMAS
jgi:hypothetical protein